MFDAPRRCRAAARVRPPLDRCGPHRWQRRGLLRRSVLRIRRPRRQEVSNLVAIAYPDRDTAEQVRRTLLEMQKEHLIELEDLVVVTRNPDGKVKLHQGASLAGAGAAGGALWGGLIGLLFFAPLFGMAIGAASGAA